MLNLQARIHFEEVKVFITIDDKLYRSGRAIINRFRQRDSFLPHRLSGFLIQKWTRRFLYNFLISALNRAFAFPKINHIAMLIAQHLNFDMAWLRNKFFNKDSIITKAGSRFIFGGLKTFFGFLVIPSNPHTLPAATGRSFNHHRISDFSRYLNRFFSVLNQPHMTRNGTDTSFHSKFFGGDFIAHHFNRTRRWADKRNALLIECFSKKLILTQKTIPRMNSFSAGLFNRIKNFINNEIALRRRGAANMDSFISLTHMQSICISI